jgi:hypothetical protein
MRLSSASHGDRGAHAPSLLDDDGDGVLLRYSRTDESSGYGDYEDGDIIGVGVYVGKNSRNATNTTAKSLSSRSRSAGSTADAHDVDDDGDHPPPPTDPDSDSDQDDANQQQDDADDGDASSDDKDASSQSGLAMSSTLMAKLKLGRTVDAAAVEPRRVGSGMLRVGDVANGLHCNECGMFCADDHVLFVHKQQVHQNASVTVGNSAASLSANANNARKASSPPPTQHASFRCGLCHKVMASKAELEAHVERHESDLGLKDVATTTLGALYGLSKAGDAVSSSSAASSGKVSVGGLGGSKTSSPSSTSSGGPVKKTKKKIFGSKKTSSTDGSGKK